MSVEISRWRVKKNKVSFEEKIANEKGLNFVRIRAGKFQRSFSLRTFKLLVGVIGGLIDSIKFFRNNNVCLVFSTGGYVTVPLCFVAGLKRIPVVIHEQTTRVGLSNKISSYFAKRILLGFEESSKYFPKSKTQFVGNTVREIFFDPKKYCPAKIQSKIDRFKERSDKYPIILVCGGGQGSKIISDTVRRGLRFLVSNYQLIIQTGDNQATKDYEKLKRALQMLKKEHQSRVILTKFIGSEMGEYFDAASLFVGRSGAAFVTELGFTATPSILIPIPWVTHNEQYYNAEVLQNIGLAKILEQGVLSPEILVQQIDKMVEKIRQGQLKVDEKRRKEIFVSDAAKRIVKELEKFNCI